MWDAAKTVLTGTFTVLNTYIRKEQSSKTNNLSLYLGILEEEEEELIKLSSRKK